ncbi:hypothetical protein [Crocosphaera sp. Alani8]|uniref:hypothetical protein n=1 Tax=Crocosphaera sp. Alani8 TaxID=3038952 RepID=UPI00313B1B13
MTYSLDLIIIKAQRFPDEVFQTLIDLFTKEYFLEMEHSRYILYIFLNNFDLLSKAQKDQLILSLEQGYEELQDWMSWFTISEILGEYYQNKQALQTLCNLKKVKNEHPRSFIVHGLEHLVKSPDINLSQSALVELLSMKNDSCERVKYEVNLSLNKLKNQGYQ